MLWINFSWRLLSYAIVYTKSIKLAQYGKQDNPDQTAVEHLNFILCKLMQYINISQLL